jgi:O-antigen ligase
LVVGFLWPDLVLEKGNDISLKDAWHGLASQKNEFGQLASFGVIVWLHAFLTRELKLIYVLIGGSIAALCLFFSRSSTSILATAFAVVMLLLLQRPPPALRRYMPYLVATFAGLLMTYALAVLNLVPGLGLLLEPFTAITGKDMTFSNRVLIWQIVKEHIQLSPILGSGYGAYWVGPFPTSPSYVFLTRIWVYPTQSHNGFLEIANDLGFVGVIFLLGYLIVYVKQCLKVLKFDRAQAALYIAIMFQQSLINLSEACWISPRSASSYIMILATIGLARTLLDQRLQTSRNVHSRGTA